MKQVTQKAQPIVSAVKSNQTAMRVINNIDGFSTGQRNAQQTANTISSAINISSRGLNHVLSRHVVGGSQNVNASTFLNSREIPALVRNAEKIEPILQENGNLRRVLDAGRMIGTDRATGQQTSMYTVITDMTNSLITAHPGLPGK